MRSYPSVKEDNIERYLFMPSASFSLPFVIMGNPHAAVTKLRLGYGRTTSLDP